MTDLASNVEDKINSAKNRLDYFIISNVSLNNSDSLERWVNISYISPVLFNQRIKNSHMRTGLGQRFGHV